MTKKGEDLTNSRVNVIFFVTNGPSSNRKHLYWISIGFWWVKIALFWAKAPFLGFEIADFEVVLAF